VGQEDLLAFPRLRADGHVLDEAHLQPAFACPPRQRHDIMLGHAANAHGVNLDRGKAHPACLLDASQDALQPRAARQGMEALRVQGVEADVEPVQPGLSKCGGLLGQEQAVGR
jgi:hypothetical protein